MKHIQKFKTFQESLQIDLMLNNIDLMESLSIWHDTLLSSIGAEEVDIFDTFKLPKEEFEKHLDIEYLDDSIVFLNSLASIALKKSKVEDTDSYQTFLNKPCRFMLIYDINSNELENPVYILFQSWNDTIKKWDTAKLYKVNDDIKKFFDKMTSKTIEVMDDGKNYIYMTSNGSEWELQNSDKES